MAKRSTTELRQRRHTRLRKRVHGTPERPRLAVFKSNTHFYAQIIDDEAGRTLASASTLSPALKGALPNGGNTAAATAVAGQLAEAAKAAGVFKVVFDHGGFGYRGKIKAFADAARAAGLEF
ncbi:MAG TPA: 50S ribosomal protein L18 [bacterium]|nr:50S ribosomal protein L18 [bacterium]